MRADKITLHNFRNLLDQSITFDDRINIIYGANGTGKTNLLESIYFSSIGRSPRTHKDTDCLTFGQPSANITLDYTRAHTSRTLSITFGHNIKKNLTLDHTPTPRISDIVGNFGSIYFSPDETQIIRGSPQYRRKFIDIILCQIDRNYLDSLSRIQRAYSARNTLLKQLSSPTYPLQLEVYDTLISTLTSFIITHRAKFLTQLSNLSSDIHFHLSDQLERISLSYRTFLKNPLDLNASQIQQQYLLLARNHYPRDLILKHSSIGIHNDDFDTTLQYTSHHQNIHTRHSASLGQQRTATLALKLAEVQILHDIYGEPPVLLLDDVFGELDSTRQAKLLDFCQNYQTIITSTHTTSHTPATCFTIHNGKVTKL